MNEPVLSCTGISKAFEQRIMPSMLLQDHLLRWSVHAKRWSRAVLTDIDLTVRRGEWVGLYGPNGTGKTTLLRILAGLMEPDTGSVECSGSLSCFFDLSAGFHPERSAPENIYLHGLLHGRDPHEIRSTIDEIIGFAGTESHRDLPMKCYSTGMNLRVAFAASSLIDADLYLFDEILAVGDAAFQVKCKDHLQRLRTNGKSAVLVTHSLSDLERMCDRVLILEDGGLKPHEQVQHT